VLLRELVCGSTRFNDLRRGLPRMSPALLSKRLKDLESAGIVVRSKVPGEKDVFEYRLTEAGRELAPVVEAVGVWGQRWVQSEASLKNLDPNLLMWDIRRNIDPKPMPDRRSVIQFIFGDLAPAQRHWWLVIEPGNDVDLCSVDPGFDVDLYLSTDVKTMTEVWMGFIAIARAKDEGRLTLTGDRKLETSMKTWLRLSHFAKIEKLVA
jgi:DNA-binding HxlR family transcriptional regulator